METKNTFYIAGYLNGNQVGVVDSDGKLNYSDNLDLSSWMHFEDKEDAENYVKYLKKNDGETHPAFHYEVEEWEEDYYLQEENYI